MNTANNTRPLPSLSGVFLSADASLNLVDKAFENGCIDGNYDRRWKVSNKPTPNVDGILLKPSQREAVKAYKLGYAMVREIFSF